MRTLVDRVIALFTSLRLTVVLLAFAILLVFIGTLAQVDEGLYNAQARYFRQWIILSLDLFGHPIPLLLPGGYLIGTLLVINLVFAHVWRFQLTVKKIGIQLAHAGVILLLVGQLATDMLAHESQIRFAEGQSKSYGENARANELAFVTDSGQGAQQVIAIPDSRLVPGAVITDPNLPFTLRVQTYWSNSEPTFRAPMMKNGPLLASNGVATRFDFHSVPETRDPDEKNVPAAIIEIVTPSASLGTWLVSGWTCDDTMIELVRQSYMQEVGTDMAEKITAQLTQPQTVTVDGRTFTFSLRPQRVYFPFSLQLLKATHTVYPGTDIPKDFRSRVHLRNPTTGENRDVEISMNHPLRYAGLTFYQYQMDAGQAALQAGRAPTSVLQVVRNPGWLTPYVGCAMVALGLMIQFLFHLVGFLSKRRSP
ncbi:MAG: cytochrome c biogenesis protein ResB [Methylacidiphilales bacterium]|nr:cytochrome c biogenesis protein ResB [Candidatus Methylacidiphilales bacterium]